MSEKRYPYGREGVQELYSEEKASEDELRAASRRGDNKVVFSETGEQAILYEAPDERYTDDEKEIVARGVVTVWNRNSNGKFEQNKDYYLSGDDGTVYERFEELKQNLL